MLAVDVDPGVDRDARNTNVAKFTEVDVVDPDVDLATRDLKNTEVVADVVRRAVRLVQMVQKGPLVEEKINL